MRVERRYSIDDVRAEAWRAVEPVDFPFFDLEFLGALERSGSVGRGSGWRPVYLVCEDGLGLAGALCVYVKTDSYGEYIFDWEWAHAYHEHGVPYYPKLVSAVPFTPATGPKLLVRPDADPVAVKRALLEEVSRLAEQSRVSSTHALFVPERETHEFAERGYEVRHSLQFHWQNPGYRDFSDYLDALVSKRRRQISRERSREGGQLDAGISIERLTGEDLTPSHAAMMYRFYLQTLDRKWGMPYLNEAFFHEVFATMRDRVLLVLARDEAGFPLAGALNFFKGETLFGRYWGAAEDRRNLHFELCYYQAIEFAIERGMRLFEAGAQGEHKHARGFLPQITYSAHDIRHPAFREAIGRYLDAERDLVAKTVAEYARHDPYKK